MTPEQVLSIKPRILTQKQREFYFENGYILLEKFLSDSWIERLRATTDEMVDRSRNVTKSDEVWDIDRGHTAQNPRLRRLSSMNDHHPRLGNMPRRKIRRCRMRSPTSSARTSNSISQSSISNGRKVATR